MTLLFTLLLFANPIQIGKNTYQLYETLGSGTFGTVYRARMLPDGEDVALKIAKPVNGKVYEPYGTAVRVSLGNAADPYVIPVLDSGVATIGNEEKDVSVLPLIPAESTLDKNKTLIQDVQIEKWGELALLVTHMIEAIAYLEDKGVVHGDVKLSSIFWDPQAKRFKLSDLTGMHRVGEDAPNFVVATPRYQIPDAVGTRSSRIDYFALGIVILELIGENDVTSIYEAKKMTLDKLNDFILHRIDKLETRYWTRHSKSQIGELTKLVRHLVDVKKTEIEYHLDLKEYFANTKKLLGTNYASRKDTICGFVGRKFNSFIKTLFPNSATLY